jgi:D-3-phosphoglycerate dehydrogenase / 2-oxoglutarate reductase
MKVLVVDKFPDSGRAALQTLGLGVTYEPEGGGRLPELIAEHDILIVRSSKVSGETLRAGKALQLVVRAGAGVNTIDVATASAVGVFVANCPGKNAVAVAELAIGLMIATDRRIPQASAELKAGKWNKKEYGKADGLFGKTLGIVGMGEIGREVALRARGLGMRVIGWSRTLTDDRAQALGVTRQADLEKLGETSDVVSLHLALAKDTRGLIGPGFFAAMKPRGVLINTAREGIVDEPALLEAMKSKGIRYAADVFDGEPAEAVATTDSAIARHPDVIATPHVGASTEQAQQAVADETVRIIESFVRRGQVPNVVNLCKQSPARWQLNVRHLDKVGVLAAVLASIREAGINVEEVENIIFDGAKAACARIRLGSEPKPALVAGVETIDNVIGAQIVAL